MQHLYFHARAFGSWLLLRDLLNDYWAAKRLAQRKALEVHGPKWRRWRKLPEKYGQMQNDRYCRIKFHDCIRVAINIIMYLYIILQDLQEEQSFCFLKALQNIHLGQLRIKFSSPFCVAGAGRSIKNLLLNIWEPSVKAGHKFMNWCVYFALRDC